VKQHVQLQQLKENDWTTELHLRPWKTSW